VRIYVLDSTAIFQRKAVYEEMVTVPEVVSEILDENSSLYLSVKGLRVESASQKNLRLVMEVSAKTGDIYRLSETDMKVIAKALDEREKGRKVVLVTDDYSIQNVALALGIEFEGVIQQGISKALRWMRVCRGCGRKIDSEICPICGCEAIVRKVKR